MQFQYFGQEAADTNDFLLKGAIAQGYVPGTCLLGGLVVMDEMKKGNDPCAGCNGPREKCKGRLKGDANYG